MTVSDGEGLFVFHEFISVKKFFGGKDPGQGMSIHSRMLASEVMERKSCWITDAEIPVMHDLVNTRFSDQ